jgi:hypothetical protein
MREDKATFTVLITMWALATLAVLAFWVGVVAVISHFIHPLW